MASLQGRGGGAGRLGRLAVTQSCWCRLVTEPVGGVRRWLECSWAAGQAEQAGLDRTCQHGSAPFAVLGLQQVQVRLPLVANHFAAREAAHRDDHGCRRGSGGCGERQRRQGRRRRSASVGSRLERLLRASKHPHNTSRHFGRWGAATEACRVMRPARAGPALACKLSSRVRDGRSWWQAPGGCKQRERACRKWGGGCGERELVLCCAMGTGWLAGRRSCNARRGCVAWRPCSESMQPVQCSAIGGTGQPDRGATRSPICSTPGTRCRRGFF